MSLAHAVIGPLKSGLQSFNTVSQMLLKEETDYLLPDSQTFHEIRPEIENMKKGLERAEQVAMQELRRLDGDTERLTAEQNSLNWQKRTKEGELATFRTQLSSHISSLNSNRNALGTYRGNLRSAEETLASMKRKRDEAEKIRNIGIGLMFIPILGTIAGQ